jgi:hypothetical protein
MKILSFVMVLFLLTSCDKPDPNPELKDPIYSDLQSQFESKKKLLEGEIKMLEGHQHDLEMVTPQSGEIKTVQKKITESRNQISKLEQEKVYLELKIESRKKIDMITYSRAYKKKEVWPNPSELASYKIEEKLRSAKRTWSSKDRIKEFNQRSGSSGNHGEGHSEH